MLAGDLEDFLHISSALTLVELQAGDLEDLLRDSSAQIQKMPFSARSSMARHLQESPTNSSPPHKPSQTDGRSIIFPTRNTYSPSTSNQQRQHRVSVAAPGPVQLRDDGEDLASLGTRSSSAPLENAQVIPQKEDGGLRRKIHVAPLPQPMTPKINLDYTERKNHLTIPLSYSRSASDGVIEDRISLQRLQNAARLPEHDDTVVESLMDNCAHIGGEHSLMERSVTASSGHTSLGTRSSVRVLEINPLASVGKFEEAAGSIAHAFKASKVRMLALYVALAYQRLRIRIIHALNPRRYDLEETEGFT